MKWKNLWNQGSLKRQVHMCTELLHVTCMYIVFTTGERMVYDGPHGESMTSDGQHEQGKH